MKKLLILVPFLTIVGCASTSTPLPPVAPVKVETAKVPDFDVHMMTRTEVITAINQCETNDMKPFVEYITQKTEYAKVMVPVNVHCDPVRKR